MEQGDPDVSPRIRARAVAALGGDFRMTFFLGGSPVIHDAAHARVVETVLGLCHASWLRTVESPVPGPGRRSTDLRLDRVDDTVLMEVETHVRGLEAIIRECADKRAAVAEAAPTRRIHVVLVLPRSRHHQALATAHPTILGTAFPASQADLLEALTSPDRPWPGDGILWTAARNPRA
jgi:hypothetical protein